jgi:hypothetical protein
VVLRLRFRQALAVDVRCHSSFSAAASSFAQFSFLPL